jgi:hypothetical protein
LIAREKNAEQPMFVMVYLTANHFPWTTSYRPDLTPAELDRARQHAGSR